jgi:2-polyprenyl-3-methyl-5-hydroxy-6-metoxy-1,4-benzoquinol methylase
MNCLFCQSEKIIKAVIPRPAIFNNKIFSYYQCCECKLVFINPVPGEEDYKKMYAADYHEAFYFKDQPADFSYLLPFMESEQQDRTLLDYGCGDASFLKFFLSKGYQCSGTEYDPLLVKKLKEQNPSASFYTISEFWKDTKQVNYNFIHLGDVLEHLEKPREFLLQAAAKLDSTKGVLLVEGPLENNKSLSFLTRYILSWLITKLKPGRIATHVPYHITFSNAKNQLQLFESCGFCKLQFRVFETAWPYPSKPGNSIGSWLKYAIGRISIFLSKLLPLPLGNRFIYAGKMKNNN